MTVGDRQASSRHEPVGSASVSRATPVAVEDRVFDIGAGDAKELRLRERVIGPDDDPRLGFGHDRYLRLRPGRGSHMPCSRLRVLLLAQRCATYVEGGWL